MDASTEESADRQHHRGCVEGDACDGDDAGHATALDPQIRRLLLEQGEVRLVLELVPDGGLLELSVRLRSGGSDGGPLARVECSELDAGSVDAPRHTATQGVYLSNEVTLADAPEGGVAAHLPQGLDALGQQQGAATDPSCGERCFGTGMAAADHDHIERVGVSHGCAF